MNKFQELLDAYPGVPQIVWAKALGVSAATATCWKSEKQGIPGLKVSAIELALQVPVGLRKSFVRWLRAKSSEPRLLRLAEIQEELLDLGGWIGPSASVIMRIVTGGENE